jgi:hypothetical protein
MIEPEKIALSALQHWRYCPRQCEAGADDFDAPLVL